MLFTKRKITVHVENMSCDPVFLYYEKEKKFTQLPIKINTGNYFFLLLLLLNRTI